MEELGYDRNVYVLTQPKGYQKEKSSALPLIRIALRKTPKIVEAMEVRHEVYNRQMAEIAEKEARGEILVIRPPESLGISRTEHDPNELERVYQTGRREAYRMLQKIRAFLKE
jgi:predicted patatin/cPLA2 family phospholipase